MPIRQGCNFIQRASLFPALCFALDKLYYVQMDVLKFLNMMLTPFLEKKCRATSSSCIPSTDEKGGLDGLPREIKGQILQHLPYEHICQLKSLSRRWRQELVQSGELLHTLSLKETPTLTACYFFIESNLWNWAGFDPTLNKWRRLPPLTFLPSDCSPDADLIKEFLICTHHGLVCMNLSKSPHSERLIVFNPLSGLYRELPPLQHRRNPVLMHMLADPTTDSYQILVAGSTRAGDESPSKFTELYDSTTEDWALVSDFPGPAFALNEFQAGVFQNGNILCIGFVELHDGQVTKGILGFNVEHGHWWTCPFPSCLMTSTILQLVESHGEVFLFCEKETSGRVTEHIVYKLEWNSEHVDLDNVELQEDDDGIASRNACKYVIVVKARKRGGRSLEVYPESVLVSYGESRLCVSNSVDHSGEVYGIGDGEGEGESEVLSVLPLPECGFRGNLGCFTLNPMSFLMEPRFSSKV